MSTHRFHLMTDEQLADHIKRLEYLAGTSEDTDEYAALLGKTDAARTELANRKHGGEVIRVVDVRTFDETGF